MSIRKLFGFLIPGIALVIWIYFSLWEQLASDIPVITDAVLLYTALLLLSYFLGSLNIQIFFRVLDLLGRMIDRGVSRITLKPLKSLFEFLSAKFHIFNLCTLEEESQKQFPGSDDQRDKEEYGGVYWKRKIYVLERSSVLGKEIMETEADINFSAGIFAPTLLFGIYFLYHSSSVGVFLIVATIFFALRFQHLRHDDIEFVAHAFETLQNEGKKLPTNI